MTLFFSSDTHFCHANILKYCGRPFSNVHEMNEAIIANWNKTVTNNDIVYFLGDFGLGPKSMLKEILSRLKRKKIILISGNHDKGKASMLDIGFDEVHDYAEIKYQNKKIFLSHCPMWSYYHSIILCGHIHNTFKINGHIINVGQDVWGFKPVSIKTILELELNKNDAKGYDIKIDGVI
jgi:calcineurin-like phosphoesterase family protein